MPCPFPSIMPPRGPSSTTMSWANHSTEFNNLTEIKHKTTHCIYPLFSGTDPPPILIGRTWRWRWLCSKPGWRTNRQEELSLSSHIDSLHPNKDRRPRASGSPLTEWESSAVRGMHITLHKPSQEWMQDSFTKLKLTCVLLGMLQTVLCWNPSK